MENLKVLAIGILIRYISVFIYLVGFVGIAMDEYTVFAVTSFLAILGIILSTIFELIFVVKTLKAKS